jgi:hypothetical protein
LVLSEVEAPTMTGRLIAGIRDMDRIYGIESTKQ